MKTLRWITGHPVLSLVIITIVYGLINLSNLGRWLGTEQAGTAHKAPAAHEAEATAPAEGGAPAAVVVVEEEVVATTVVPAPAEAPAAAGGEAQPAPAEAEAAAPEAAAASEEVASAEQGAAEKAQPAAEEKSSGGIFTKLFSGKPAAEMAEAAGAAAEGAAKSAAAVAEPVKEAAEQAAEVAKKEEKGSLFDFFKRKKSDEQPEAAAEAPKAEEAPAQAEAPAAPAAAAAPAEAEAPAAAEAAPAVVEVTITMARQAFWAGDFPGAASMYETLIEKDAKNADLYGEYGNMLIQSGNLKKGLEAYESAADLMIEQGRFNDVMPLIRFIGNYDRPTATALYEKLPRR